MSSVTFFANKKGVSPLIATVLLIAFAVALGAVIMNWGRGFVQDQTANVEQTTEVEVGCALDVQLKVSEIGGTPQLCYGGSSTEGYFEFTLDNQGRKDVKEIGIIIHGQKAIYQNSTLNNSLIIAGGAHYRNLSFNFDTYGDVKYVRFIPKIDISGVTTPCSGSSLQKDAAEIRNCSSS
ncbi:hypothetical protein CMO88_03690 [Candidatus Woesearchaeota archaeon]|nr:hypothetical protein [Candidatus Woesearchaeota archaeon]|tara:strand:+ start:4484 stop:5020 length:537 start_codon:yes stop_codon:yes gene_type:complete